MIGFAIGAVCAGAVKRVIAIIANGKQMVAILRAFAVTADIKPIVPARIGRA
jgi:hypothetical protein